jgi:hypothetical protein
MITLFTLLLANTTCQPAYCSIKDSPQGPKIECVYGAPDQTCRAREEVDRKEKEQGK